MKAPAMIELPADVAAELVEAARLALPALQAATLHDERARGDRNRLAAAIVAYDELSAPA